MCIFCASRLYLPPPPSVVPRARPLYTQRRALQSSARTRKPAAAATALQDEEQQEGTVSRPSPTPVHPALRPTSLRWTGSVESPKTPNSPGVAPAKLSWDGWSATLEGGTQAQVQRGVPPGEKDDRGAVGAGSRDSESIAHTSNGGASTKVCGRSDRAGKKHRLIR